MKIIIEVSAKEIAALVLELQERPGILSGVTKSNTYDLIVKHDQVGEIVGHVCTCLNLNIGQE